MRVEYYLTYPEEVLHFAPVLHALVRMGVDAYFVSRRGDANTAVAGWDTLDANAADALMERLKLPFVPLPDPNADIALTILNGRILRDYRKLRARMMYGVGLVPPKYDLARMLVRRIWGKLEDRLSNPGFDLYLVHGEFSRQTSIQFLHHGLPSAALPPQQVQTIGYPRFDAWFNSPLDSQPIRAKYGANSYRPAILYLPTWQYRSSIDAFTDSIFALSGRFEIFVKPHHLTYRIEPERIQKLSSGPVRMLSPTTPPEEAFAVADIVISDVSSGALTEAILVNKKVVCLAQSYEVENLLLPEIRRQIPICFVPEDLSQKIDEALALDTRSGGIQELRRYMFDTSEGADGERAARAIVEFTDSRRRKTWSTVRTELRWCKQGLWNMVYGALFKVRPARALRNRLRRGNSG